MGQGLPHGALLSRRITVDIFGSQLPEVLLADRAKFFGGNTAPPIDAARMMAAQPEMRDQLSLHMV